MIRRLYRRYLDLGLTHPWRVLAAALLVAGLCAWGASKLELRTSFRELLPEQTQSVRDLDRIERRIGKGSSLLIAAQSPDRAATYRFIDALAAKLRRLPKSEVRWVDADVRQERAFFERHKLLFVEYADLAKFRDRLRAKIAAERRKHDPLDLGLESAKPVAPLELDAFKKKYESRKKRFDSLKDGYYTGRDGLVVVFLRLPFASSAVSRTRALLAELHTLIAELKPALFHRGLQVRFGGDAKTTLEEYESTKSDLLSISSICIGLELLVIILFFLSFRSLLILGAPVLMGTLWTMAVASGAIGYLNTSTMFLASIVVGNGVNVGIILLARYLEERRSGQDQRSALQRATRHTARATLIASLAAGVAYASLLVTDFRGFNQFGLIGGAGMVLCWLATFLLMPSLIAIFERRRPLHRRSRRRSIAGLFASATRAPRTVVAIGLGSMAVAAVLGGNFLGRDPFQYDFRQVRNQESLTSGSSALNDRVRREVPGARRKLGGMAILVDHVGQLAQVTAALRRFATGPDAVLGKVTSIASLVPSDQRRKLPVIRDIRKLLRPSNLKWLRPAQRRKVERLIPPADLQPVRIETLPEKLARPFTTIDGQRGLLFYVQLPPHMNHWDGRNLLQFAAAVREIRLPGGAVVRGSGNPVIFADMLGAVLRDGPRAAALALVGVLLIVLLAFRRLAPIALSVGALLCGVAWLLGAMGGWDLLVGFLRDQGYSLSTAFVGGIPKLNFLNFVALPLTIGIGVDYAVNIVQRYREEGPGSMRRVLRSTGGAVALCSLTTIIGYGSLLLSKNMALASFGKLAGLGEIFCLLAAMVLLPAGAVLLERRRRRREAAGRLPDPV